MWVKRLGPLATGKDAVGAVGSAGADSDGDGAGAGAGGVGSSGGVPMAVLSSSLSR